MSTNTGPQKWRLSEMTWKEAEQLLREQPTALLPIGTVEQNGPHCPLGTDYLIADYFADNVARDSGSVVLPPLPFGCSDAFKSFPGTISIHGETLTALVRDTCESLADHGVQHILAVNNHGPNAPFVEAALREVRLKRGIRCALVWPSEVLKAMAEGEVETGQRGHGGEPMTSIMRAIAPEMVRMDLCEPDQLAALGKFKVSSSQKASYGKYPLNLMLDLTEVSSSGTTGDGRKSSPDLGQRLLEDLVVWGVEMVRAFKELPVEHSRVPTEAWSRG